MVKIALYLAGGGARGAYQTGVLKAIHDILQVKNIPFDTISGVSVGSITAAILAQHANNFTKAIETLEKLWYSIHCQQIFSTSNYELGKSVLRNLSNFIIKQQQSGYLLNTDPLREFIKQHINFATIKDNINHGHLHTLEVLSHCYETQQTISFYQHYKDDFDDWQYPRHVSQRVKLSIDHILASGALPLFFPPVRINDLHYGDGSMGLVSPLRGPIRFQVEKILILGTRQQPVIKHITKHPNTEIGFANILGSMLNGFFLDNLDRDIEMVNRMNDIARMISLWNKRYAPWRPIETLYLRPSISVADIAQVQYENMPALLRYLLNILGAKSHSGDLLSFLLFEEQFATELIKLGRADTLQHADTIKKFFA